jgi:hypothetical protein
MKEQVIDMGNVRTHGDEDELDPRAAARLLLQTQWQARRGLDFRSLRLSLIAAAVALVALGAVWLSVRGQHPYKGPTAVSLAVLYAVVAIRIATVVYAHRRATAGVSGRSVRQQRAEAAALAVALIAVYAFMAPLARLGANDGVVYGIYVVTAPLIVLGAFWAARSAVREDWPGLGMSIAVMLVAAGSAFAGPRGVWLSDGVGLCVALLGYSAAQAWLLRSPRSGT